jgi:hypothetical protein
MGPNHIPAALKGEPNPPQIKRPRKLQNALDTIQLYGGFAGVTSAAKTYGCEPGNIKWHLRPWSRIDCGGVYLDWDAREAAKARREGKA